MVKENIRIDIFLKIKKKVKIFNIKHKECNNTEVSEGKLLKRSWSFEARNRKTTLNVVQKLQIYIYIYNGNISCMYIYTHNVVV